MNRGLRALVVFLWCGIGCSEEAPPPPKKAKPSPVADQATARPVPTPAPNNITLADKMAELQELRKTSPKSYQTLLRGWSALQREARDASDQARIKEELDGLDSASNKAYRDLTRPLRATIREALDAGHPETALHALEGWAIPPEFDFDGRQTMDRQKELGLLGDICQIDARRRSLLAAYMSGDLERNEKRELSRYLASTQLRIRVEAEKALAETKRVRALQTGRLHLAALMAQESGERTLFGEFRVQAGPTERRLDATRPAGVYTLLSDARAKLQDMAKAATFDAYESALNEGMAFLDRGTASSAFFPVTWYVRAEWKYGLRGDVLGALWDLDQAISQQRNYVEARMARALLLLEVPMGAQAEKELRVLSRALPEALKPAMTRALAKAQEADYEAASQAVLQAMRTMPVSMTTVLEGGWRFPDQGL